jgi:hypothetical protein
MRNDLTSFCFLTSDPSERKRLAKSLLADQGKPHGGEKAKEYLRELDDNIRNLYRADRVEIVW